MLNTASPKTIRGAADLRATVGKELGISSWYEVTQDRVTAVADATGDRYWIHVDPKRAEAEGMTSTIAHGLFTLSLGPQLMDNIVSFEGFHRKRNYGYDRVRFLGPVPVNSRLRMRLQVVAIAEKLDRYGRRWSRRSSASTKQSLPASLPASCVARPADD